MEHARHPSFVRRQLKARSVVPILPWEEELGSPFDEWKAIQTQNLRDVVGHGVECMVEMVTEFEPQEYEERRDVAYASQMAKDCAERKVVAIGTRSGYG